MAVGSSSSPPGPTSSSRGRRSVFHVLALYDDVNVPARV